jgi:hypothetical protein
VQVEPRVATILNFSTPGNLRRAAPPSDARAEIIVFPRTEVRALRRLSDIGSDIDADIDADMDSDMDADMRDEAPPCGDHSPPAPGDDGAA